jgi:RNA polymerase sigma-70 factor (ECF subfamily)
MTDNELVRAVRRGDKGAFDALVRRHYQNIFAYCYRRIGEDAAADVTQSVFLKLVESIYRFEFSGKFSNYLFTIAVNACTDRLRRRVEFADVEVDEIPDGRAADPENALVLGEQNDVLSERLSLLPDIQRDAIILHYFHGLKARDIAAVTGVPLATAKSRIKQGMDKLRRMY